MGSTHGGPGLEQATSQTSSTPSWFCRMARNLRTGQSSFWRLPGQRAAYGALVKWRPHRSNRQTAGRPRQGLLESSASGAIR